MHSTSTGHLLLIPSNHHQWSMHTRSNIDTYTCPRSLTHWLTHTALLPEHSDLRQQIPTVVILHPSHSDTEGLSCQFNSAVCVSVCLCVILQIVLPHTDKKNDGYKNWQWFHCVFLNHIISHCPNVSYPSEIWARALKKKCARWIIGQVIDSPCLLF